MMGSKKDLAAGLEPLISSLSTAPCIGVNQEKYLSSGFQDLQKHYDWGWYDGYVYVYSEGNPTTRWSALEVTQRASAIEMPDNNPQDWIVIDNIQMLFTQAKGFFAGYPAMDAEGLSISHCRVGWVGIKGGLAADGLKVWHSNSLYKNNVVHDTGRHGAGVLPFGGNVNEVTNVIFDHNTFYNGFHTTGVDIQVADANRISNLTFINNQFLARPTMTWAATKPSTLTTSGLTQPAAFLKTSNLSTTSLLTVTVNAWQSTPSTAPRCIIIPSTA